MASEVDLCNTALSHIGDVAQVSTINPPDGSAQAAKCQVFYPIARDALLEMHDWGFATRRATLALASSNPSSTWLYAYAQPADMLNPLAVLDMAAADDTAVGLVPYGQWQETPLPGGGVNGYTPQPFVVEIAADGTELILTNQVNAVLRYVARVTDTTRFSPLFNMTLGWSLASMLAGPIIKGEAGHAEAIRCIQMAFGKDGASGWFGKAVASDANQRRNTTRDRHQVAWINGR